MSGELNTCSAVVNSELTGCWTSGPLEIIDGVARGSSLEAMRVPTTRCEPLTPATKRACEWILCGDHPRSLERFGEDEHGPCARMTRIQKSTLDSSIAKGIDVEALAGKPLDGAFAAITIIGRCADL